MNATSLQRPPLGVRLLHTLVREPDWSTMTAEELVSFGEAERSLSSFGPASPRLAA